MPDLPFGVVLLLERKVGVMTVLLLRSARVQAAGLGM